MTNNTRRWSKEEIERNDRTEGLMVFSDFTTEDEGRGRKLVCTLNENHPDFENNRRLIEAAPKLLELLQGINKSLETYPMPVIAPNSMLHDDIRKLLSQIEGK